MAVLGLRRRQRGRRTGRALLRLERLRPLAVRRLPARRGRACAPRRLLHGPKGTEREGSGASAVLIANDGAPGRTAPILGTLIRPGIGIPVLGISSALSSRARTGRQRSGPDRRRRRHEEGAVAKRDRRPSWPETRRRPAWRTPGLGRHRAGDERQRLRLGARAGGRAAGPPPSAQTGDSAFRGARSSVWWARPPTRAASGRAYAGARALNFDMVASPNFGRFVYDGEAEPPGSTRIEDRLRLLRGGSVEEVAWVDPRALCQGRCGGRRSFHRGGRNEAARPPASAEPRGARTTRATPAVRHARQRQPPRPRPDGRCRRGRALRLAGQGHGPNLRYSGVQGRHPAEPVR